MMRLDAITVEDLTPEQKSVHDAIQSGPRGTGRNVGLVGPFGIWVRSPKVGMAIQNLGAVARYTDALPETVKEIAICTVGAHFKAKFEFAAHRALALKAGVEETVLDAIERDEKPALENEGQQLAYRIAHQLLTSKRIDDQVYRQAMEHFGESALIELVSIIGYYCLVSVTLNVFEVDVTAAMADPWPYLP